MRLAREDMAGQANEFISAIRLVRGYGQEQQARQQMDQLSDAYSDERVDQMRLNQGTRLHSVYCRLGTLNHCRRSMRVAGY